MFCSSCGKNIFINTKFCKFCGSRIQGEFQTNTTSDNRYSKNEKKSEKIVAQKYQSRPENNHYIERLLAIEEKKVANREILIGVICIIVGLIITGVSYNAAEGGGTYYIFWGLIIYGGYRLIKGLAHSSKLPMLDEIEGETEKKVQEVLSVEENTSSFWVFFGIVAGFVLLIVVVLKIVWG